MPWDNPSKGKVQTLDQQNPIEPPELYTITFKYGLGSVKYRYGRRSRPIDFGSQGSLFPGGVSRPR